MAVKGKGDSTIDSLHKQSERKGDEPELSVTQIVAEGYPYKPIDRHY